LARRPASRCVNVDSSADPGIETGIPQDSVAKSAKVGVPLRYCRQVITDFVNYPKWTGAVTQATVLETDDQGRDLVVKYDAGALGVSASYTLKYAYDGEHTLAWESIGGSIKKIVGSYDLTPENDASTNVAYTLAVDVGFYLPGYLKRALTKLVISIALGELRKFSETTYQRSEEVPAVSTVRVVPEARAELAAATIPAPPLAMSLTADESLQVTTTRAPLPPGLGDRDPEEELQPKRIRKRDRVKAWVKRRWRKVFPKKKQES